MFHCKILLKPSWAMFTQQAKAHRKPRWLPVAKSKIYRIPQKPIVPHDERVELKRLNNIYNTQMQSLRRFFHEEMIKEKSTVQSATSKLSKRLKTEEWEKCIKLNEEWNAKVAADREQRRKLEINLLEERAHMRIMKENAVLQKKLKKASEEIKYQKELSKTFITPETLDEAIEHALTNITDYNFAVDKKGNIYNGRDSPIVPREASVHS